MRPVALVVHRARTGQSRQATLKVAARVFLVIVRVTPFGQVDGADLPVDGEVVDGEPAGHRGPQRRRLDHRPVAGVLERGAGLAGAVGAVAEHVKSRLLALEQPHPDRGVLILRASRLGQRTVGDNPGIRLHRDTRPEPVLATVHRLVRVPRLRVDGGDHPVGGDPLRDPPSSTPRMLRIGHLQLATEDAYAPLWGSGILFELDYVLAHLDANRGRETSDERRRHLFGQMKRAFPGAEIDAPKNREYDYGLDDPDDGHVAHAALIGQADAIVTDDSRAG